ncbi:NAD(P)-dependent oxidoreductase [Fulvimarina sp. 2208YS6-2-32]|uniref:NAD(P)-dependent oxidoreductase n=1 Tax=Fulvimarina uroteuthidis TaxID=3098149 RepID=A0ABU5I317_9HYPH|nr:NAD(P)-dependent oxidoreductase [Fulvimarina sp. 2208YS6-2-32]MDY8109757.1 NAD(P)-dependent oxidoreductase [Fulvimarina sp. 2208YS6-2-32]
MSERPIIGFIGVGYMGHGMAKNLIGNGYRLVVKGNRNRQPVESLLAMGASEADTAREMAERCDVIHLCLSNSPEVEAVMEGEDGLLAGARKGLVVIDATTADPASTLRLAGALAEKGATLVDAPLGRTPKEAEAGTLDCMVGGAPETFEAVKPIIQCWAGNIRHVGPVGSGHKMKLIMNFISMGYAALYAEATVTAAKAGIHPETVRDVIGSSRLSNGFFDTFMRYAVDRDRDAHKFTIANASKDLRYLNAMAAAFDTVGVMAPAARYYFAQADATGAGGDYVPMIADHVARLNGIDLAEEVKKPR